MYLFYFGILKSCIWLPEDEWPVRRKHVAYVDETNKSSMWLTAVIMILLMCSTESGWIPQNFLRKHIHFYAQTSETEGITDYIVFV
jgi:hypothetical protein